MTNIGQTFKIKQRIYNNINYSDERPSDSYSWHGPGAKVELIRNPIYIFKYSLNTIKMYYLLNILGNQNVYFDNLEDKLKATTHTTHKYSDFTTFIYVVQHLLRCAHYFVFLSLDTKKHEWKAIANTKIDLSACDCV